MIEFQPRANTVPGWDSNTQIAALATSLRRLRNCTARIAGDSVCLVASQNSPVTRYEIDELLNFVERRNCFHELRANVELAQGGLCDHLQLFRKAGYVKGDDPTGQPMDRVL